MMKYVKYIMLVVLLAGSAFAGPKGENQKFYAADASPAVWVQNTFNEDVTGAVTGVNGTITITVGSTANTIDASGTSVDTIAELEAAIKAVTNSAGKTGLDVYRAAAAGTESIDEELLATSLTITKGSSGGIVLWDTSATKHYRAYMPPSDGGASRGQLKIKSVYGDVKGTGTITMKAYTIRNAAATQIDMKEFVSPIYLNALSTNGLNTVADEIGPGVIDIDLDHQISATQGYLFSADRATTGTTGGIGIRTEQR
jgi:hypothetical protein